MQYSNHGDHETNREEWIQRMMHLSAVARVIGLEYMRDAWAKGQLQQAVDAEREAFERYLDRPVGG